MDVVPSVVGITAKDAENRFKFRGFIVEIRGSGMSVKRTAPASGVSVQLGAKVVLNMGNVLED